MRYARWAPVFDLLQSAMRTTATLRYAIAFVALLLGLALSIQFSDRGFLFESPGSAALAASRGGDAEEFDLQQLRVLNQVILNMRDNYVQPDRVDPHLMLLHALDGVQNRVPEVVSLFDRPLEERPTWVDIRVGAHEQRFELGEVDSLWGMSFKLREVFRFLQAHLDPEETEMPHVEYAAVNGMLRTLDPHSVLLDPRVYRDMQTSNRGSFGGLGIVISIRDGDLTVISPITDTPASRAGFRPGDRIVKINDESTMNMPLDEAVSRLRGDPGTSVTVEVMREGWTEPHQFTLEREIISIQSVRSHALGDGVGYIQITNFQEPTYGLMMEALRDLDQELGGLRGLVLDMRNNPGGLLRASIRIADAFLSEGTIVTTVGVGARMREENHATRANTQPTYPIVVLVNEGSASASEIVAGALRSHNRALVLGDRTFGKGSVQMLYPLNDGSALKLTIAEYLTPGDVSIQGHGIVPDIAAQPITITEDRIRLYPGERISREEDMFLTPGGNRNGDERPSRVVKFLEDVVDPDAEPEWDEDTFEIDFQIELARQILQASAGDWERTALLGRANAVLERTAREQMLRVQEQLRQRNIDWSAGENVVQPVALELRTSRPGDRVGAGGDIELTARIENRGSRPMYRLRAVSRSDYRLFNGIEFVFGRLEPGESREWTVSVTVPEEDPNRVDRVRLEAFADEIDLETETHRFVEVRGEARPHWGFSYAIDDREGGNGDGRLQVGETVRMHVDLHNTGLGDSRRTMVFLRNRSDAAVMLRQGREEIEQIPAGEQHRVTFEFDVQEVPEEGEIRVSIEVFDTVFREFVTEELRLPVTAAAEDSPVRQRPGHLVVTADLAPVRSWSHEDAPVLAIAQAGALLPTAVQAHGHHRVELADGLVGWVAADAVRLEATEAELAGEIAPRIQFNGPRISLGETELRTTDETVVIRGRIEDDVRVRDFFFSVYNNPEARRPEASKRAYRFVGEEAIDFEEIIELQPGMNRISIVARDFDRISTSRTFFVYRDAN
ncbi:MAG: PDZ domain-containing protein [Deltaproteobacteria bacterium]|nr:MAG: PDZ domain-containing protein [Deltaproteobacteria bacterium]